MFRCAHQNRLFDADHGRVFQKRLLKLRGILLHAHTIARRVGNNLVVHICNVHHVADAVTRLAQKSLQQVYGNKTSEVSDVAVAVDRRPASIHTDFAIANRNKFLHPRGHGVVEA